MSVYTGRAGGRDSGKELTRNGSKTNDTDHRLSFIDGGGRAHRMGAGRGDAVRAGSGPGDAVRDGAGAGDALRSDDGPGRTERAGSGPGSALTGSLPESVEPAHSLRAHTPAISYGDIREQVESVLSTIDDNRASVTDRLAESFDKLSGFLGGSTDPLSLASNPDRVLNSGELAVIHGHVCEIRAEAASLAGDLSGGPGVPADPLHDEMNSIVEAVDVVDDRVRLTVGSSSESSAEVHLQYEELAPALHKLLDASLSDAITEWADSTPSLASALDRLHDTAREVSTDHLSSPTESTSLTVGEAQKLELAVTNLQDEALELGTTENAPVKDLYAAVVPVQQQLQRALDPTRGGDSTPDRAGPAPGHSRDSADHKRARCR